MSADISLVICRFLFDISALFLWGSAAFVGFLVPKELEKEICTQLTLAWSMSAALVGVTTLLWLPIRAAILAGDWSGATNSGMVSSVLFETSIGRAWQYQAAAVLILVLSFQAPERFRSRSIAVASAITLLSLVTIGHAAGINSGWTRLFHKFNDGVHVLAAGSWLGALVPVALLLGRLESKQTENQAMQGLIKFSAAGHVAVTIVVLSGAMNVLLIVGGFPLDWRLPYQALLSIKVLIVTIMIAIAVLNRYLLVPRWNRAPNALPWIRRATISEIVLGTTVVALVAWFGMLPTEN